MNYGAPTLAGLDLAYMGGRSLWRQLIWILYSATCEKFEIGFQEPFFAKLFFKYFYVNKNEIEDKKTKNMQLI